MRPTASESRRRKVAFLCAVASGTAADQAAKDAGLDPWRALRIVTESDFNDVVRAIREGAGPVVAVDTEQTQQAA